MRSLKIERKPRRGRTANPGRTPSRGPRVSSVPAKTFGKRKPANIVARVWRNLREWTAIKRPMFTLAAGLIGAAFVAALFVKIPGYPSYLLPQSKMHTTALA